MSQHLQKEIKKDVRKWSQEFLEIPNKHLGGIPACPFAKKSWNDNKVIVEIKRKFKVYPSAYANMYASAVCSGKVTPGGKRNQRKKLMVV